MIAALELHAKFRLVNPRARRIADMHASVPELTNRIFSTDGKHRHTDSARFASPECDVPKLAPRPAASRIASTTGGNACPRIIGPHEPKRSRTGSHTCLRNANSMQLLSRCRMHTVHLDFLRSPPISDPDLFFVTFLHLCAKI
jgi:hypothetical protein